MAEAQQIVQVLETLSQPILDHEVGLALRASGRLIYDGDLTGRPVSNTSTTYPNVAFGHMSDGVRLGYQAAMVSLHSPTYGRLWLSVTPHPGDTVSCTQAEALVRAAEARTGVRPWRRTELLRQRLQALRDSHQPLETRLQQQQQALERAQDRLQEIRAQVSQWEQIVRDHEATYQKRPRTPRPHSRLAQARARWAAAQDKEASRAKAVTQAQQRVERTQERLALSRHQETLLQQRLEALQQDNATNAAPVQADFRVDAGFGTYENLAFFIEMGYEVYTKPYSHQVPPALRQRVTPEMQWQRVGANAEMVAWPALALKRFPYPLDTALERFHTGETLRYGALLHYGQDPVTTALPNWFHRYNGRQTIEAGIREGKQVFQMHHLKVRTAPALFLQEHLAAFATNFVRWTAHWIVTQCPHRPADWQPPVPPGAKELVQVAAHTSAWVLWQDSGCWLQFTDQSFFAGQSLEIKGWAFQPSLPLYKN